MNKILNIEYATNIDIIFLNSKMQALTFLEDKYELKNESNERMIDIN
jgi:hypothetical protein